MATISECNYVLPSVWWTTQIFGEHWKCDYGWTQEQTPLTIKPSDNINQQQHLQVQLPSSESHPGAPYLLGLPHFLLAQNPAKFYTCKIMSLPKIEQSIKKESRCQESSIESQIWLKDW